MKASPNLFCGTALPSMARISTCISPRNVYLLCVLASTICRKVLWRGWPTDCENTGSKPGLQGDDHIMQEYIYIHINIYIYKYVYKYQYIHIHHEVQLFCGCRSGTSWHSSTPLTVDRSTIGCTWKALQSGCDGRVKASATVGATLVAFIGLTLLSAEAATDTQRNCITAVLAPTEYIAASDSVKDGAKSDAI